METRPFGFNRAHIPYIISRHQLVPAEIVRGLERSSRELTGAIPPERVARRTLVRVVEVGMDGSTPVADVIIHTWDPDARVRFPLAVVEDSGIERELRLWQGGELRLFAEVNVGCENANELFFRSFEFAPEPDIDRFRTA